MNSFDLTSGRTLARARDAFAAIEDVETMLRPNGAARSRVSASALYAAVRSGTETVAVAGLLGNNRAARAFHRQVVAETAAFELPMARAASSGAFPARHGEGCNIRIERSRAEPDQYFVVVELLRQGTPSVPPTSLVVCNRQDICRRFPLPPARNGVAQIIAEADSDLMRMMGDPASRVYLL